MVFVSSSLAQTVELSSPLGGYVHFGRAAAVHVSGRDLGGMLTLWADGVIPVRIPTTAGRVEAVVPLHWQGEPPTALAWSDERDSGKAPITFRTLGVDDRLVAAAGEDIDATLLAADLFPAKRPIVVQLPLTKSRLAAPAAAYEAADLLLLDKSAAARMDESQLRTLLAGGTTVAIRSTVKPVAGWPWVKQGGWWVLRHEAAGPRGGIIPDIYAPTYSWDRSWPAATRLAVTLSGCVGGLVVLGISLWRGRWGVLTTTIASALGAVFAGFFGLSLAPVASAEGEIVTADKNLCQRDRWTYLSALRDTTTTVPAEGLVKPALGTRRLVEGFSIKLLCGADGSPQRFEATLPAKMTVAFVARSVWPTVPPTVDKPPITVPIGLFADKLYPGTMTGETEVRPADATGDVWWGTVLMKR